MKYILLILLFTLSACDQSAGLPEEIVVLQARSDAGDIEAQYQLGMHYATGTKIPSDNETAVEWMKKAAKQGHIDAMYQLGSYYTLKHSTDYTKAVRWLQLAAKQKHSGAQYLLGTLYFHGIGVDQDFGLAYGWVFLAARKGDAEGRAIQKTIKPELTEAEQKQAQELIQNYQ